MTLPALSAVGLNFPESRLEVLTRPWALAVYQGQPEAAAVRALAADGPHRGFFGRLRLARELAAEGFDLALLFQNAFEAAALAALARIPERWGYARDGRAFLLSRAVKVEERDRYVHQAFYYLTLLEKLGLEAPFSRPRLKPPKEALPEAGALLHQSGGRPDDFLLAAAPGAAFGPAKRWPVKNFAEAALMILERTPDPRRARIMILGGPGEVEAAGQLAGLLPPRQTLNLAGRTSLGTAMALMSRASLLISNDSGLMHVGGGLDIPLAAVFGPTDPLTTAPLGQSRLIRSEVSCAPCLKRECPLDRQHCFDQVSPEKVAAAALDLLRNPLTNEGPGRAVFLDRDGTLIEEANFIRSPEQVRLIPGAGRAVAALNQAGYRVVLVTNQSGLARGLFSLDDLKLIHRRLARLLAEEGARLDAVFFCPHHPEAAVVPEWSGPCNCRKPALGLFEEAIAQLKLDPRRSVWVGDRARDLAAAEHYGGRSVLVLTGYGLAEAKKRKFTPTLVAPDLPRAVEWIL
jgi:heptosyltransferase-2